jgi:arylsulfatase A-like enzyme
VTVRRVPIVWLASAVLASVAAGAGPDPGGRLKFPVLRLVDAPPATLPDGIVWGGYVKIADEERLTLGSLVPAARFPRGVTTVAAPAVLTEPFEVPPGAVLTFGIGVDARGPGPDAPPIEFRIDADTTATSEVLFRGVYDPGDGAERRWRDERVDLSAHAGRTIRLRLSTTPGTSSLPGPRLPVWADPVVSAPRTTHVPNVVIVSLDTLRARSVGAYGAARPTTPALDGMVGVAGTVFEAAYTTAPHTLPAHLSLFTGRYPRNLGGANPLRPLAADVPTLTERLRAAGYATAAFTEDGYVIPSVGFRRGFSHYRERTSPERGLPTGESAQTFRDGVDWLSRHRDRPTFLFLHTYDVHDPYLPPPPYDAAFEPQLGPDSVPEAELLRYEQEARYLDDELRALVESIDALGLGTRTLLVVLSDHGEEFMEHGQTRHCFQLYEETIHVPLVMRLPGVVPAGRRIETPVSLVDVAPTVLDLVGAPPIEGIDGVSLVPLLQGRALPAWRRAVFSETLSSLRAGTVDLVSARSGHVRCTYETRRSRARCFDLARDPEERTLLSPLETLHASARAEAVAYAAQLGTGAGANPQLLVPAPPPEPDRLEKLRALGYVQ